MYVGGQGAAFVFKGSVTGIASVTSAAAATRLISTETNANFAYSVAGAGDVNGDGYADIIVGAPYADLPSSNEGAAHVWLGSATGIASGSPGTASATFQSNETGAQLGISGAGAGDLNGDGYGDVVVGADHYGTSDQGSAFVWFGGASGVPNGSPANANTSFAGALANGALGASVACAGDLNGDGLADLIVGATDPVNFLGQGCLANVYMGTTNPLPNSPPFATLQGIGGLFGASVAGVGDVDGDGYADVIVGAPGYEGGRAYVYAGGSETAARPQLVRQLTGDGLPVQKWGLSYSSDRFRVAAVSVDADGRKRVKLEVENCPWGVPFGSVSCTKAVSPTWMDTGAHPNGASFDELLTSVPGGLRKWRARTLVAPFNVTKPGITAPPKPAHGPWRRFQAQVGEADVRVQLGTVSVEIRNDRSSFAIERLVNPTRGRIEFSVVLPGTEPAKAELFDVTGRRWLSRGLPSRGPTRTDFRWEEGRNLPAGVYLLRLEQGGRAAVARIAILH
jgi:hypothetical protein